MPRCSTIFSTTAIRTVAVPRLSYVPINCGLIAWFSLHALRLFPPCCATQYTRRSSVTQARSAFDLCPAASRLRCYVPVYTYLITGYNTPEKLGEVVSCVPAASPIPPPHSPTIVVTGASLYVPPCFQYPSLLTVHVETEVIPNVSHPRACAHLESF